MAFPTTHAYAATCPVSAVRVDEHCARVAAALVFVLVSITVATGAWPLALALAADFGLKVAGRFGTSPTALVARALLRRVGIAPRPVDAAPKRFAAACGLAFSLGLAAVIAAALPLATSGVAALFAGCAVLEAAFGICVGCHVYALIVKVRAAG